MNKSFFKPSINCFYIKLTYFTFFLNIIHAEADIIKSLDLMPFEENISAMEISHSYSMNEM